MPNGRRARGTWKEKGRRAAADLGSVGARARGVRDAREAGSGESTLSRACPRPRAGLEHDRTPRPRILLCKSTDGTTGVETLEAVLPLTTTRDAWSLQNPSSVPRSESSLLTPAS